MERAWGIYFFIWMFCRYSVGVGRFCIRYSVGRKMRGEIYIAVFIFRDRGVAGATVVRLVGCSLVGFVVFFFRRGWFEYWFFWLKILVF